MGRLPGCFIGAALCVCVTVAVFGGPAFAGQEPYDTVAVNFLTFLKSDKQIVGTALLERSGLDPALSPVPVGCLVRLSGGGYLLIAVSRQLTPVKAYSLKADFETLPPAYVRALLREMEYNTRTAAAGSRSPAGVSEAGTRWDFLLNFEPGGRTALDSVPETVLLTTTWEQGAPFNKFLPEIGGEATVAGCVNIAMAQIMRYHAWPAAGSGVVSHQWEGTRLEAVLYHPFNWEHMPDVVDGTTPSYQADEVALLVRDLAIMNGTDFGCDESSASPNIEGWVRHFGYSTGITQMKNDDAGFFDTVKSEIDDSRPVLLSLPGHMTVADGYRDDDTGRMFHINMGWGGHDDDYYFLDETIYTTQYYFDVTPPSLEIYYGIAPCSGEDCFVNLEPGDAVVGDVISGSFAKEKDADVFQVYLSGATSLTGGRGYPGQQGFFVSVYDSNGVPVGVYDGDGDAPLDLGTLPAGRYDLEVSLCGDAEGGGVTCWPPQEGFDDYTVTVTTTPLTTEEKAAVDDALEAAPVMYTEFTDRVLDSSDQEPVRMLVDARDGNGDAVTLAVYNTNPDAVTAVLEGNVLAITPVSGATGTAAGITVRAEAGGASVEKTFVVMVLDHRVGFGKSFTVHGVLEQDPDDFLWHDVVLDGTCTIIGDRGFFNQAFYSTVRDDEGTVVVAPVAPNPADPTYDEDTTHYFSAGLYRLGACLEENPGGYGGYWQYEEDTAAYSLTVSCPDAG